VDASDTNNTTELSVSSIPRVLMFILLCPPTRIRAANGLSSRTPLPWLVH